MSILDIQKCYSHSKPAAKHNKNAYIQIIDEGGALYRSDGEYWVPQTVGDASPNSKPLYATDSAQGVRFVAPSGTVAADGTVTLGTALPAILASGVWLYFPAGAFSTAPAGWYWVAMSSTTAGTVYTSQGGAPVVGSASAYTGVTSKLTAYTIELDAPSEGESVTLRVPCLFSASTNAKTCKLEIGATQLLSMAVSTAGQSLGLMQLVFAGLGGGIVAVVNGNGGSSSAGAVLSAVGNTITVDVTLQLATATEYVGAAAAVVMA